MKIQNIGGCHTSKCFAVQTQPTTKLCLAILAVFCLWPLTMTLAASASPEDKDEAQGKEVIDFTTGIDEKEFVIPKSDQAESDAETPDQKKARKKNALNGIATPDQSGTPPAVSQPSPVKAEDSGDDDDDDDDSDATAAPNETNDKAALQPAAGFQFEKTVITMPKENESTKAPSDDEGDDDDDDDGESAQPAPKVNANKASADEGDDDDDDDDSAPAASSKAGGTTAFQTQAKIKGNYQTKLSFDTVKDDNMEDVLDFRNRLYLESWTKVSPTRAYKLSGLLNYNLLVGSRVDSPGEDISIDTEPNPSNEQVKTRVNPNAEVDLYEAYLSLTYPKWELQIGQQEVIWGRSDVLSPVDFVTPGDYRELVIFSDFGSTKIPIPLVKASYFIGLNTRVEGIYIPFFQEAAYDMFGTDYSLIQSGIMDTSASEQSDIFYNLNQTLRGFNSEFAARLQPALRATDFPEDNLRASEVALRLMTSHWGFDFEFNYLYSYNDTPFISFNQDFAGEMATAYDDDLSKLDPADANYDPSDGPATVTRNELVDILGQYYTPEIIYLLEILGIPINEENVTNIFDITASDIKISEIGEVGNPSSEEVAQAIENFYIKTRQLYNAKYMRTHILGGGFSTTFNKLGIRSEGALTINYHTLNTNFELVPINVFTWTAGVDYNIDPLSLRVIGQYYQKIMLVNDPKNLLIENRITGRSMNVLIFDFLGNYLRDKLTLDLQTIYIIDNQDMFFSPRVSFNFADNFELMLGTSLIFDLNKKTSDVTNTQGTDQPDSSEESSGVIGAFTKMNQIFVYFRYNY